LKYWPYYVERNEKRKNYVIQDDSKNKENIFGSDNVDIFSLKEKTRFNDLIYRPSTFPDLNRIVVYEGEK